MAGKRFVSSSFAEADIKAWLPASQGFEANQPDVLTQRERETLPLVSAGHTNRAIGDLLYISPRTIEIHRANVMRKLYLHTQSELIRYALRSGILARYE